MKTILFVMFMIVANDGTITVTSSSSTEFGSGEACAFARGKLAEVYQRLNVTALMLCGPYDMAKLKVEQPSKSAPKTEAPIPKSLEQQLEELKKSKREVPKPQHFLPPNTPLHSTQSAFIEASKQ